jgi:hypothetical protein
MLVHKVLLQTAMQDAPNGLKEMTIYDVYEEEQHDSTQSQKCSSEPPKNPLPQAVSELAFPENAYLYVSRYIKFRHLSVTHFRYAGSGATGFSECKCLPFCSQNNICVYWASENGMATYFYWDPGVLKLNDTILDKCAMPHQVQLFQQATAVSPFSSEARIRYYAPNGVNSVLHAMSSVLQRATHCFRSFHYKTEYCHMSCLWKFSVSLTKHVQWDPRVKISLDYWFNVLTVWSENDKLLSCTHIPDLAVWPNQSVGSSASYIWDPGTMLLGYRSIWWLLFREEKVMVGLITEQWTSWFNAMHYGQTIQKCNAMNSQLYWQQDIKFNGIDLWMIHFQPP